MQIAGFAVFFVVMGVVSSAFQRTTLQDAALHDLEQESVIAANQLVQRLHGIEQSVRQVTLAVSAQFDLTRLHDGEYLTTFCGTTADAETSGMLRNSPLALSSYVLMNVAVYGGADAERPVDGSWYYMDHRGGILHRSLPARRSIDAVDPTLDWYFSAFHDGDHWTAPYRDRFTDDTLMVSCVAPVEKDGVVFGMAGCDVQYSDITAEIQGLLVSGNGFGMLLGDDLSLRVAPEYDGKVLTEVDADYLADLRATLEREDHGYFSSTIGGVRYLNGFAHLSDGQVVVVAAHVSELLSSAWVRQLGFLLVVALGLGVFLLMTLSLVKNLSRMSSTDTLTGLGNRRHFLVELEGEVERAKRYASPLSVLFVDLDHFKVVNDRLGHAAGDRVLQEFAQLLVRSVRKLDSVARWGGEEFIVLCRSTDLEQAMAQAERIRTAMEAAAPEITGDVALTCSIGVASFRPEDTVDALLDRSDEAMYEAKAGGRNRVAGR